MSYTIIRNAYGTEFHPGATCINVNYHTPGSNTAEEEVHKNFSYRVILSSDGSHLRLEPRPNPASQFHYSIALTEANAKHLHIYEEATEIAPELNRQRWYRALEAGWVIWAIRSEQEEPALMAHNLQGTQFRILARDFFGQQLIDGLNEAMWHSLMNRIGLEN
jgi:hypothetical protein